MQNILVLKSSILDTNSQSNLLSNYLTSKLSNKNIVERDLATNVLPHFDSVTANALRGEAKNEEEKALLALSDTLVEELKNSDLVVINAPMYNFNIPTQLKSYFDFIARPRVTFQYTENGPEGLIKGKKALVILTSGGIHQGSATDLVAAYMKIMLGFIGITDVEFVYAEGLGMGGDAVEKAQTQAKAQIDQFLTRC
ncbi:FMN-dependent NADH-azoreductase [Pasteurella dagmatis]|uniref:FMN dependent NADH:quinone oxidoreductase n=1 Tax=Pasteurella dagmatis ATCC 43325 TaxID=667128 RepID=C9PQY9_9PAST|nr:FMN-dependent NADH-azoreductase [Pasteurella dagmatis]EEX49890.1 flavodoxin-like protein [Pasteurella dagmatis ATCC 43325]SNV60187.1 FMN-dependent NADH-azoreductase [Pasteurella dagmatis]